MNQYGREWEKIGTFLGRTALNVRDKYKSLGDDNVKRRVKTKWTLNETISLIRMIEAHFKKTILSPKAENLDSGKVDSSKNLRKRVSKNNSKFEPDAVMVPQSPISNPIERVEFLH